MTESNDLNLPVIFVVKTFETSYTPRDSLEDTEMTTCEPVNRTLSSYSSAEELQLHPRKAKIVHQRRSVKDLVLRDKFPPSPAPSPSPADTTTDTSSDSADDMPISPTTMDQRRTTRDTSRGSPGYEVIPSDARSPEQRTLAKQRSQYYEDAFAYREKVSSARERISRESMVMADVRTNVIIEDEYTFITDLSYTLSTRYQRPESCILVTIDHSACLLFGGSFDPAYTLTITALPSQLQPVTNKRNAALLQKAMEDTLGVIPERGIIKFVPIAEENLATNGKTVAADIEDLERESSEDSSSIRRTLSRNKKRQSTRSLRSMRRNSPLPTHKEQMTPPVTAQGIINVERVAPFPPMPPMPADENFLDRKAEKVQKMSRRKSFIEKMFGKGER